MKFACSLLAACLTLGFVRGLIAAEPDSGENPAEHLPPHISRVTWFGECDKQNHMGSGHVDLWKLALDGSGSYERLTYFSDFPGFKASNPVVSDDGRFIAFQLAKSREAAGVGHGIFVLNLDKAPVPR